MRTVVALILGLVLFAGPVVARSAGDGNERGPKSEAASNEARTDTPKDANPQPAKPADLAKPRAAKKPEKAEAAIAVQIEELRQTLQSQQEQLQLLKEELAKRDRQIDEAREAAAAANARAGEASAKVTENVFSARQSRLSLLLETNVGNAKVTGYVETDFLGAGVTSNNRQSNSYVLRYRQFWGRVAWQNGFSVSAGQMWSLVTESKKGIENRQENLPLIIDPQYIVGWAWQRAYGFRVAKDFGKFDLGASIEGPPTTFGGRGSNNNFFFNTPGVGGGLNNFVDTTGYTAK